MNRKPKSSTEEALELLNQAVPPGYEFKAEFIPDWKERMGRTYGWPESTSGTLMCKSCKQIVTFWADVVRFINRPDFDIEAYIQESIKDHLELPHD